MIRGLRMLPAAGIAVLVLAAAATSGAWGRLEDIRYKVKPEDGNLWADRYARGAIVTGKIAARKLMFTFDDGPYWPTTTRLLEILKQHRIRTAFFVSGHRLAGRDYDAMQNRRTLREEYRRGHLIGNHGYTHGRLTDFAEGQIRDQIDKPAVMIRDVTGSWPVLFRPPFAVTGQRGLGLVRERGYTPVLWCIDPIDWVRETPDGVFRAVVRAIEARNGEGGIVLLHDTHAATVQAFPRILSWLEEKNAAYRARGEEPYELAGLDAFFERR